MRVAEWALPRGNEQVNLRHCSLLLSCLALACDGEGGALEAPDEFDEDATVGEVAAELIFLEEHGPPDFRVAALNVDTLEIRTLFSLPSGSFAYGLDVHRDTGAVLLSYTEPAAEGEPGFDRSSVFVVEDDGLSERIAGEDVSGSWAQYPRWSADGSHVWYVSTAAEVTERGVSHALVRAEVGSGKIDTSIDWATEPAVSPDGQHLAWVSLEVGTWARSLQLGTADGAFMRTLVRADAVYDLGHPIFSGDGLEVYVFIPEDTAVPRAGSWTDDLSPLGHGLHLVPGDWWAIELATLERRRLTDISAVQYAAAPSADGRWLSTASATGIELVDLETGAVDELLFNRAIRSLAWRDAD